LRIFVAFVASNEVARQSFTFVMEAGFISLERTGERLRGSHAIYPAKTMKHLTPSDHAALNCTDFPFQYSAEYR